MNWLLYFSSLMVLLGLMIIAKNFNSYELLGICLFGLGLFGGLSHFIKRLQREKKEK